MERRRKSRKIPKISLLLHRLHRLPYSFLHCNTLIVGKSPMPSISSVSHLAFMSGQRASRRATFPKRRLTFPRSCFFPPPQDRHTGVAFSLEPQFLFIIALPIAQAEFKDIALIRSMGDTLITLLRSWVCNDAIPRMFLGRRTGRHFVSRYRYLWRLVV